MTELYSNFKTIRFSPNKKTAIHFAPKTIIHHKVEAQPTFKTFLISQFAAFNHRRCPNWRNDNPLIIILIHFSLWLIYFFPLNWFHVVRLGDDGISIRRWNVIPRLRRHHRCHETTIHLIYFCNHKNKPTHSPGRSGDGESVTVIY